MILGEPYASAGAPLCSVVTSYLWLVYSSKSLEDPFQLQAVDPGFKFLKFGCCLDSEESIVGFFLMRFKGRFFLGSKDPLSRV